MRLFILLGLSLFGLAACGDGEQEAAGGPFDREKYEAGGFAFERSCKSCHAVDSPHNGTGPHLLDLRGRKAGTVRGFDYSDALRQSKIVWTMENLNEFMANVRTYIPGTKMVIENIDDPAIREALSYFLFARKEE